MRGRIVGETVDVEGRRGFVHTQVTREQHNRREKATSNICTNEGLCALMSNVFMCTLGKAGMRELARQNFSKSHYAADQLARRGNPTVYGGRVFNEFVIEVHAPVSQINRRLA